MASFGDVVGDIFRGIGGGLRSVAQGVGNVLASEQFQRAAIGLGTEFLASKISRPPPGPTAMRLPPGFTPPIVARRPPAPVLPAQIARGPRGTLQRAALPLSGEAVGTGLSVIEQLLPGGLQGGRPMNGFVSFLQRPGTEGGGMGAELLERARGAVAGCPTMFREGPTRMRALPLVEVPHPETGETVWFRHVGRPILFSGDVATARRVRKVATRVASRVGARRPSR